MTGGLQLVDGAFGRQGGHGMTQILELHCDGLVFQVEARPGAQSPSQDTGTMLEDCRRTVDSQAWTLTFTFCFSLLLSPGAVCTLQAGYFLAQQDAGAGGPMLAGARFGAWLWRVGLLAAQFRTELDSASPCS